MWSRADIKSYAKDFLRRHYLKAFIVVLITTLLSGGASSSGSNQPPADHHQNDMFFSEQFNLPKNYDNPSFITDVASRTVNMPFSALGAGLISITAFIIVILFFTIGLVTEVGQSRFFLRGFKGDVSIGNLFSGFNREEYFPIVKTQLVKYIYLFLWTLLLIIPGLIKAYEYRFVSYIIAEQPHLSAGEAISKSREMTRGHKMNLFVLDLSFMGWYMLGALFFGIGAFFVNPYKEATEARLYNILSEQMNLQYEYSEYGMAVE